MPSRQASTGRLGAAGGLRDRPGDVLPAGAHRGHERGDDGVHAVVGHRLLQRADELLLPRRDRHARRAAPARRARCRRHASATSAPRRLAVRDDAHPGPARQRLGREQRGDVHEFVHGADPDAAALAQHRVERLGGRAAGAHRMPGRDAERGPPRPHDHDRLARRQPAGDAGELARVAHALEVEPDDGGALVLLPVLHAVVPGHVGAVARGHEGRDPDPAAFGGLEHGRRHRRRTGRTARPGRGPGSVGSSAALSRTAGSVLTSPQEFGPTTRMPFARATRTSARCRSSPSRAGLREAAAHHDEPADARARALVHHVEDGVRGHGDDGEVERGTGVRRQIRDRTDGAHPEHLVGLGVHDVQRARRSRPRAGRAATGGRRCQAGGSPRRQHDGPRRQQRGDAAELRPVLAARHHRQRALGGVDVEGQRDDPVLEVVPHLVARRRGTPPSMRRFCGSTSATNRCTPCSRAAAARCSSSTEPSPRPWWASETLKATSAVSRLRSGRNGRRRRCRRRPSRRARHGPRGRRW